MGRPLPGYRVVLVDAEGLEADQGEIALRFDPRPVGLMRGYQNDAGGRRRSRAPITAPATSPARRRWLHHLYRPRRRCVQIVRLSPEPLRIRERAHRACGGRRSRCRAGARSDPLHVAKAYIALAAGFEPTAPPRSPIFAMCASASRPSSACGGSNSPNCRRPSPARSAASNSGPARRRWRARRTGGTRVPERGFSGG